MSPVQAAAAAGALSVWGRFPWHVSLLSVAVNHRLYAITCLGIVAQHVHPFMATIHHCLMVIQDWQHDNAPCHKATVKSSPSGFMYRTMSSLYFSRLPPSPDLNPIEHLWDVMGEKKMKWGMILVIPHHNEMKSTLPYSQWKWGVLNKMLKKMKGWLKNLWLFILNKQLQLWSVRLVQGFVSLL